MPDLAPDGTPRDINLNSDTEHVRRALYDRIVLMQFSPVPAEDLGPDDSPGPGYGPDDAGLKVYYLFSRYTEPRIMPSKLRSAAVSN